MAINDTPWCGASNSKLFLQSGAITSTLKTSQDVFGTDAGAEDISWDGTNTPWVGGANNKLFLTSGQFTATIKDSLDIGGQSISTTGISWDGTNTPWSSALDDLFTNSILILVSGQFTSTTKDSVIVTSAGTANSVTWDGTNSPWSSNNEELKLTSGQFTSTIKESISTSGLAIGGGGGMDYDGADTLWTESDTDKLWLLSGQFTTTVKSSYDITSIDSNPRGISTNNVVARLGGGSPDTTGDGAFSLPSLVVITMNVIVAPVLTLSAVGKEGFNDASMELSAITVSAYANMPRGNVSITLPRPTFDTVAQQGSVENIEIDMPMITLSAYSGHLVDLTVPSFTLAASGENGFVGTFTKSLGSLVVNVKASQENVATFTNALPQFSLDFSGLQGIVSTSTANRDIPMFILNAHAYKGNNADGSFSLPIVTLTTEVALNPSGDTDQSLLMITLDAYADSYTNRFI